MDLGKELIDRLREFANQLKRGERIEVTTVRRCDHPDLQTGQLTCPECGNKGFIRHTTALEPREPR